MASKINWHRYGTKLRHGHPVYRPTAGGSHGEVRAGDGGNGCPVSGVVDDEQQNDDDNDDDDAGYERANTPRHRAHHLHGRDTHSHGRVN